MTQIPTPSGWKKLADIQVGDEVFDESGRICRVTKTFDAMPKKAYRLHFSDGAYIDACGDHQWVTWTHAERKAFLRSPYEDTTKCPDEWPAWRLKRLLGRQLPEHVVAKALAMHGEGDSVRSIATELSVSRQALAPHLRAGHFVKRAPVVHDDAPGPQIRTTQQVIDTFTAGIRGDTNHSIPLTGALQLPELNLPLDPYVLGAWLGDGSSGTGDFTCDPLDQPELRAQLERAGYRHTVRKSVKTIGTRGLQVDLRGAGVLSDKHVPALYLRASIDQRLALLQGLMDTDGYAATSHVEFCNTRKVLVDAVVELARSLGQKPVVSESRSMLYGKDCGPKWRVKWRPTVPVFRLRRKAVKISQGGKQSFRNHHRMIVRYEEIDPVPMRCLTVDSKHSMFLAGEGMIPTHNTRTGAEWIKDKALALPDQRGFIAAPTFADARNTCVEGESGLLRIVPPALIKTWNRSLGEIVFVNDTRIKLFSGDEPERFRGPQHHFGWFDELGAFRYPQEAWDQAMFGMRLGEHPQTIVTTTPRTIPLIQNLLARDTTAVTRGATFDNQPTSRRRPSKEMKRRYEGTRLGRQELYGELLTDVPGALATYEQLDRGRIQPGDPLPEMIRKVCAVDPAVTNTDTSDATGITVLGRAAGDHVYLLDDVSLKAEVEEWAYLAIVTAIKWGCGVIVYEANQGGDSIGIVLRDALRRYNQRHGTNVVLIIKPVTAKQSKWDRSLPLQLAIQQVRFHIVGSRAELEGQLTSWVPINEKGKKMESPNNLDSSVHGYRDLMDLEPASVTTYQRTTLPGRR